jgi:hypothetical protein
VNFITVRFKLLSVLKLNHQIDYLIENCVGNKIMPSIWSIAEIFIEK